MAKIKQCADNLSWLKKEFSGLARCFFFISIFLHLMILAGCDNKSTELGGENELNEKIIISISTGNIGYESELLERLAQLYNSRQSDVVVKIIDAPDIVHDKLGFYNHFLRSRSPELDVFIIDVVWVGDLAEHFVDLYRYGAKDFVGQHFLSVIENNTVQGAIIGMPFFVDAGVLYYRHDLLDRYGLEVPTTWQELEVTARIIQAGERESGNADFYGFVWQGNAYEGLTCNATEWIASNDGGRIIEANGDISINNSNALEIIEKAVSWVGDISPALVTSVDEEGSRAFWQSGNAAFMRNWPYAYSLGQNDNSPIADLFSVTTLPAGQGRSASALGGWQLAVSQYSKYPQAAADFVFFMTSPEVQKIRALEGSYNPTIPSLYDDKDILNQLPFFAEFKNIFQNAVARPSTITSPHYEEVSASLYINLHHALTGKITAQEALNRIEAEIREILE